MGRFHTKWLNMMYPRLKLASYLLRDDGICFISIDDSEVHNLRKVCDEVFGEENFIAQINWKGRGGRQDSKYYAVVHEYILCYCKSISHFIAGEEIKEKENYPKFDEEKNRNYKTQLLRKWGSNSRRSDRPNLFYPITAPNGKEFYPMLSKIEEGRWRWSKDRMEEEINNGNVEFVSDGNGSYIAYEKIYEPLEGENRTKKYTTWIDEISSGSGANIIKDLFNGIVFDYSKPIELIQRFILMANIKDNDIILDFFSGSATTAHAVMQLNAEDGGNRQFIMVQLPELCDEKSEAYKAGYNNICEIGKERIRRAGKKILEENNQLKLDEREIPLDVGFKVFKLDTSNLNEWNSITKRMSESSDTEILQKKLNLMLDKIKPDRSDLDVVYEVVLKLGFPLNTWIGTKEISGKKCFIVGEECLIIICLEQGLTFTDIQKMAEYKPVNLIFSKHSFADSNTLLNAHYKIRDIGIEIKLI